MASLLVRLRLLLALAAATDAAAALSAAAPPSAEDAASVRDAGATEFRRADGNNDGQLSFNEFIGWWVEFRKAQKANMADVIDFHARGDPKGELIPGKFRESVQE